VRLLRFITTLILAFVTLAGAGRTLGSPDSVKTVDPKLFQELRWRLIGPFRGGRTLAVTGVRGQPEVY
jgi:hypothetical protein